jgi:hypothetical protein
VSPSQLSAKPISDPSGQGAQDPPGTATERVVAEIWGEVLELPTVSVLDNFFDLGGHSVLIHMVHEQLVERLQKDPPIVELFNYPTVRALASYLDGAAAGDDRETSRTPAARRSGLARLGRRRDQRIRPSGQDTEPGS